MFADCCQCRCGRIWRHHAHRKAVQRSAGAAPATTPSMTPANPSASASQPPAAATSAAGSLPLLEAGALLSALLLNPTQDSVRSLSVSLLKQLCLGTPHMTIRLVSRLAAMLSQAAAVGMCEGSHIQCLLYPASRSMLVPRCIILHALFTVQ